MTDLKLRQQEDPTMAMASAHDESAVLAMESGSLAETNSSADFDLQNEVAFHVIAGRQFRICIIDKSILVSDF